MTNFHKIFVILIMFILSNLITNRSSICPVKNDSLSNEKINASNQTTLDVRVFPVKCVLSKKSSILFLVGGDVDMWPRAVRV